MAVTLFGSGMGPVSGVIRHTRSTGSFRPQSPVSACSSTALPAPLSVCPRRPDQCACSVYDYESQAPPKSASSTKVVTINPQTVNVKAGGSGHFSDREARNSERS